MSRHFLLLIFCLSVLACGGGSWGMFKARQPTTAAARRVSNGPSVVIIESRLLHDLSRGLPGNFTLPLDIPGRGATDFGMERDQVCDARPAQSVWNSRFISPGGDVWRLRVVGGGGKVHMLALGPDQGWLYTVLDLTAGQLLAAPLRSEPGDRCGVGEEEQRPVGQFILDPSQPQNRTWKAAPRRFRFAVSTTQALRIAFGTYKPDELAATNVELASLVLEAAANIRLCPVTPDEAIEGIANPIYTYRATDEEKRQTVHKKFQALDLQFDLGQVFDMDGDSWGEPESICRPQDKDNAITKWRPEAPLNVWLLVHEVSHQLGATHTFDNEHQGRNPVTAVEPGSGRSVLGYPDVRLHPWFHPLTVGQVLTGVASAVNKYPMACGTSFGAAGTSTPVMLDVQLTVPKRTPFQLTAAGNGATAYSIGEVTDGGQTAAPPPSFAARPEDPATQRWFPSPNAIDGDVLDDSPPSGKSTLKFLVLGRNQENSIGFAQQTVEVLQSGPFRITTPSDWKPSSRVTLKWETAGTEKPPLSAAELKLWISVDGKSWEVLKDKVANDGIDDEIYLGTSHHGYRVRLMLSVPGHAFFAVSQPFRVPLSTN